jgi:hypothetical protein
MTDRAFASAGQLLGKLHLRLLAGRVTLEYVRQAGAGMFVYRWLTTEYRPDEMPGYAVPAERLSGLVVRLDDLADWITRELTIACKEDS